jgi:polyhydroxyalkanoate synthase
VGGTILSNALAVMAARGREPVASATFLTTLIDFADTGILDVFIDEAFVQFRELQMGKGGLMKGQDLASTFSFLRPNDLVWNYVVGNYLKGETPPPFDLLYWNSDSTNLPGPFYAWYLRNFYLENNLVQPGKLTVCGEKLDLGQLTLPVYIYGSREDHIVPINAPTRPPRCCLAKSGLSWGPRAISPGSSTPPPKNKRSHWIRADGKLPATLEQWLEGATEHAGSWWTDWSHWLKATLASRLPPPRPMARAQSSRPSSQLLAATLSKSPDLQAARMFGLAPRSA